jgi:hypothetical protein
MRACRAWVLSKGATGQLAPEYVLIRAARYLNVAPWELELADGKWVEWALFCEQLDRELEERAVKKVRKRAQ